MWNRHQHLLRKCAQLDRKRRSEGATPLELQRRLDLGARLETLLPGRPAPGAGTSHLRVDRAYDHQIRLEELRGVERKPEERRTV